MPFFPIDTLGRLESAALLALENHRLLRQAQPYLPEKTLEDLLPTLEWTADEGTLLGLGRPEAPEAFFGGFRLDDFRHHGPGVFCPDFAHGVAAGVDPFHAYRLLYRELSGVWVGEGRPNHGVGLYATELRALEAFSLLGFGRIMVDAAVPLGNLAASLGTSPAPEGWSIRRAGPGDAGTLVALNAQLAAHLAAPPVLMPRPEGDDRNEWEQWLADPNNLTFLACEGDRARGYIRAGAPGWDVSRAVHGDRTLALSGLWVDPMGRRAGGATALLAAVVDQGRAAGLDLLSVDCETTNLEAFAFWTRRFEPLSWGLERRVGVLP